MIKAVLILTALLIPSIGLLIACIKKLISTQKELKRFKAELEKAYERIKKQNEIIQKMETGTPAEQFDASVDILHQLVKDRKA